MIRRLSSLFWSLLLLAGCATTERLAASGDVRALLVAIRDDDKAAFDAHVDRKALEAQIQSVLVQEARDSGVEPALGGLGLVLSGPISRAAGRLLVRPDVFRAVADYYGYRPDTPIPGEFALAAALTALPDGRVCAKGRKGGPCLLTFADEDGVWRLVGFDANAVTLHAKTHRSP